MNFRDRVGPFQPTENESEATNNLVFSLKLHEARFFKVSDVVVEPISDGSLIEHIDA
jgi:hypothetical protein